MIAVQPQPEPPDFEAKVRQKGVAWMRKHGIATDQPLPRGTHLKDYWSTCRPDMYEMYGRCCAYLSVYMYNMGEATIDHFTPKSLRPDLAYEWSNYRLACSQMNACKGKSCDVLDPFAVQDGWFHLDLAMGHIYPNPALDTPTRERVQATINRLQLNGESYCDIRAQYYQYFCDEHIDEAFLKKHSPFVWSEANRQELL